MKVLILDTDGEGCGVDLGILALDAGHEVKYWIHHERSGRRQDYGKGFLDRPTEWEPFMDWAELIVLTGNSDYTSDLAPYFGKGYPIFGANTKAAALELDRGLGQEALRCCGIRTLPYEVVSSIDEAITHVAAEGKACCIKPWGGTTNKALTCVPRDAEEAIFILQKWKREGLAKGQFMLQEKVDGIEMGVAGWFGPGGWNAALEESFEHKKFLNDDLGCNTGEMGTVIRHVRSSKLFDEVLEPLTDYLHQINYVGDCSVNCIIDSRGRAWPLEFTMRLGWPDFCIRQEVIEGDPVEWMKALIEGRDELEVSTDVAAGVLLAHGDFPQSQDPDKWYGGYPIRGITSTNSKHLHFQQMMLGKGCLLKGSKIDEVSLPCTAGTYVMIASGHGANVSRALERTYETAWQVHWPSNVMFRTDIGLRLEDELPRLHRLGYATGMKF